MHSTKKSLKSLIEKEQKRAILLTLNHDGQLVVNGDNLSVSNMEDHNDTKEALTRILSNVAEDDETSYNFDKRLTFTEDDNMEFPRLFAKIGGKKWKGGEISKTQSQYFKTQGFGLNAPKSYGKEEDKPVWWPKKPKWKDFRCPSKSSKEECTKLIVRLLQHYSIDPSVHYVDYPDEEGTESSSGSESSSDEGARDAADLNNSYERRSNEEENDGEGQEQEVEESFEETLRMRELAAEFERHKERNRKRDGQQQEKSSKRTKH